MSKDFVYGVNLFLFSIFTNFCHQGIKPILDHMFCSRMIQIFGDARPLFTVFFHKIEHLEVLLVGPFASFFTIVQMIEPTLSTMFWSLENSQIRLKENVFGYLVPGTLSCSFNSCTEELVLLESPGNSMFLFQDIIKLKFEKSDVFTKKGV